MMSMIKQLYIVLYLSLGLGQPAVAQEARSEAVAKARAVVLEIMKTHSIPGMSAAVAVNGKIVWSEGFGEADLENHVPVRTTTLFRLASVSKMITVAAVARLVEEGRLELDAPVQKYVPDFPEKPWPVTARQLAAHVAGIRHYRDDDPISDCNKPFPTLVEGLKIFQDDALLFQPGTAHSYSSYGYNLLGAVVEGASGKDYLAFLQEGVLDPLGMRHTVADRNKPVIEGRARFYEVSDDKQVVNATCIDVSYKWPGGGMLATAEDVARLGSAFLKPGFLKPETLKLVFTPLRLASGEESPRHEGLGWRIVTREDGGRVFQHSGSQEGARAYAYLDENSGVAVALLSNMYGMYGEKESGEIAALFAR